MTERDDAFAIPPEWNDARHYLERVLEERRTRLDRRDDAIEAQVEHTVTQLIELTKRVEETQMDTRTLRDSQQEMAAEVHGIGNGMRHLNQSFVDVSERYSIQQTYIDQFFRKHEEKQASRDERQARIDDNLETIVEIEQREDRQRYGWRLTILLAMLLSMALWAVEKIHIG